MSLVAPIFCSIKTPLPDSEARVHEIVPAALLRVSFRDAVIGEIVVCVIGRCVCVTVGDVCVGWFGVAKSDDVIFVLCCLPFVFQEPEEE
nr:hypothetical protein BaRGS_007071 [Batillaria attramentaria]